MFGQQQTNELGADGSGDSEMQVARLDEIRCRQIRRDLAEWVYFRLDVLESVYHLFH
jgi:hypothetical protein